MPDFSIKTAQDFHIHDPNCVNQRDKICFFERSPTSRQRREKWDIPRLRMWEFFPELLFAEMWVTRQKALRMTGGKSKLK
jgi:hypothetical protein